MAAYNFGHFTGKKKKGNHRMRSKKKVKRIHKNKHLKSN